MRFVAKTTRGKSIKWLVGCNKYAIFDSVALFLSHCLVAARFRFERSRKCVSATFVYSKIVSNSLPILQLIWSSNHILNQHLLSQLLNIMLLVEMPFSL